MCVCFWIEVSGLHASFHSFWSYVGRLSIRRRGLGELALNGYFPCEAYRTFFLAAIRARGLAERGSFLLGAFFHFEGPAPPVVFCGPHAVKGRYLTFRCRKSRPCEATNPKGCSLQTEGTAGALDVRRQLSRASSSWALPQHLEWPTGKWATGNRPIGNGRGNTNARKGGKREAGRKRAIRGGRLGMAVAYKSENIAPTFQWKAV